MAEESLDRIIESLAQVNVNLEGLRVTLGGVSGTCSDHEQRLREMERWKHHLTPVLAVMAFLLGAVVSIALEKSLSFWSR